MKSPEDRLLSSVEIGTLCAFYGGLLTERQRQALELHYMEDLSLGEIAQQLNVSRQNVHELITRSAEKLRSYEAALGAAGRMKRMLRELNEVSSLLSDAQTRPDQAPSLARQAQEMIQTIITQEEDAHGI
ncbi:MAG: sigma-70 family RNA polymerase sigma factor [Clostridiales bacterium]|nr:sigma-70 family RNA polymerase sigma factor [Clostridiales bacterium]